MANIDFPSSPANGQTYTFGARSWTYSTSSGSWVSSNLSSATRVYTQATATAGQNVFTTSTSYTNNTIDVYYNGVHLAVSDYSYVNSTAIQLLTNATVGAIVEITGYGPITTYSSVAYGANTQIQVNDNGILTGFAGLTYDKTSNSVTQGGVVQVTPISVTLTGTTLQTIDSWLLSTWRTGNYVLSIKDNTANGYQTENILVLQDGTTTNMIDYGVIYSNAALGLFSSSANATHALVQFTPVSTNNTITMQRTLISV